MFGLLMLRTIRLSDGVVTSVEYYRNALNVIGAAKATHDTHAVQVVLVPDDGQECVEDSFDKDE